MYYYKKYLVTYDAYSAEDWQFCSLQAVWFDSKIYFTSRVDKKIWLCSMIAF